MFQPGQKVKVICLDEFSVPDMQETINKIGTISENSSKVRLLYRVMFDGLSSGIKSWDFLPSSLRPAKMKIG